MFHSLSMPPAASPPAKERADFVQAPNWTYWQTWCRSTAEGIAPTANTGRRAAEAETAEGWTLDAGMVNTAGSVIPRGQFPHWSGFVGQHKDTPERRQLDARKHVRVGEPLGVEPSATPSESGMIFTRRRSGQPAKFDGGNGLRARLWNGSPVTAFHSLIDNASGRTPAAVNPSSARRKASPFKRVSPPRTKLGGASEATHTKHAALFTYQQPADHAIPGTNYQSREAHRPAFAGNAGHTFTQAKQVGKTDVMNNPWSHPLRESVTNRAVCSTIRSPILSAWRNDSRNKPAGYPRTNPLSTGVGDDRIAGQNPAALANPLAGNAEDNRKRLIVQPLGTHNAGCPGVLTRLCGRRVLTLGRINRVDYRSRYLAAEGWRQPPPDQSTTHRSTAAP